ncbi:hypothetical protein [Neobacillus soli]|uniref:hypothetical protein n=1 Tax=Neobacillus soli TaxID=220688 RepID=UPI00082678D3|nr:hypothetical protein [Neobacillus soli]
MDKRAFRANVLYILEQDVSGLSTEKKIKFMKKWIRDYEQESQEASKVEDTHDLIKVGILVRTTMEKIVREQLMTIDRTELLLDVKYCKSTFDINYPFLKKVVWDSPLSDQRKINGYDRYWAKDITINQERYLICNDWYERNKPKFLKWLKEIENK